jgi:ABC-type nickel/cobalt efflux system permease component RcnA
VTALSILVVGLLLGMQHATEADHLAAVATLATRQSSLTQTLRQGVAWGIGHTLTLVLFGGVVLWLGQAISPRLGQALETAVGIMLVLLGADMLRRLVRDRTHFHVHRHGPRLAHVHAHSHRGEGAHAGSAHRHAHPQRWPCAPWRSA